MLNRVLCWTPLGIQLKAAPRHQETFSNSISHDFRPAMTAGVEQRSSERSDERHACTGAAETREFRSGAARANYLCLDRPDLVFATKEMCRRM